MATLTISNNIQLLATSGSVSSETADEAVSVNDVLFKVTNSITGTVGSVRKLINTSQEAATFYGIALAASKNGGAIPVLTSGAFEMDATTFSAGECYVASSTAGKMEPIADATTSDHLSVCGFSYEDDQFVIDSKYIGVIA